MTSLTQTISLFARALRGRLPVMGLQDFDAAALRDIGLTRRDVQSALRAPYLRDSSSVLKRLCCQGSLDTHFNLHACC